ncbi:hypothetical protein R3X27_09890 [Tropicimonas sp. TH_r6]|uniref:hypothetical protein n=1 Tax=Tropicimonas sp. TH_r6 TaxID=3082085 RepID=UPI002955DB39|nr:hypothetical protein [Tropicimonas sp. TH_r6]MDV7142997.1 hypothetical protein [Tropicimonas sp. TH_r6]
MAAGEQADRNKRIADALKGKVDTTQMSEDECALWLDAFTEKMARPTEIEEAFYTRRRQLGQGVGDPDETW